MLTIGIDKEEFKKLYPETQDGEPFMQKMPVLGGSMNIEQLREAFEKDFLNNYSGALPEYLEKYENGVYLNQETYHLFEGYKLAKQSEMTKERAREILGYNPEIIEYGQAIRQRVKQWVGVPICVGIGSTKTRSKLANHIAKKNQQFNGVCDLESLSAEEQFTLLSRIDVSEVWGIGRQLTKALEPLNIRTVYDLMNANPSFMRQKFSVVVERTIRELNGVSCLELEDVAPNKKQIVSSRSFGRSVYLIEELMEAISQYVNIAALKLRKQACVCEALNVFIQSSPHKENYYSKGITIPLSHASDDTIILIQAASLGLKAIYKPGIAYSKAGVMLMDISPKSSVQRSLFEEDNSRRDAVMKAMDEINRIYGRHTVGIGIIGLNNNREWSMKRGTKSPSYTTSWDELPIVYAN